MTGVASGGDVHDRGMTLRSLWPGLSVTTITGDGRHDRAVGGMTGGGRGGAHLTGVCMTGGRSSR
jgi:hypothetical protein